MKSTTANKFERDVCIHLFAVIIPLQLWMYDLRIHTMHKERFTVECREQERVLNYSRYIPRADCHREDIERFLFVFFPFSKPASSLFMNQCFEFPSKCDALRVFSNEKERRSKSKEMR